MDVWLVDYDDGWLIEIKAYSKASMWGGDNLSWLGLNPILFVFLLMF